MKSKYQYPLSQQLIGWGVLQLLIGSCVLMLWAKHQEILQFFGLKAALFGWEEVRWLYWLPVSLLIPLGSIFYSFFYNKTTQKIADFPLLAVRLTRSKSSTWDLRAVLLQFAVITALMALTNPRYGVRVIQQKSQGAEVLVAVDVSKSMDVVDNGERKSRIERAKTALQMLLSKLGGKQIGLTIFAGESYNLLPITSDYVAVSEFITSINTDMLTAGGTNFQEALTQAMQAIDTPDTGSKNIILLSDGEDHKEGLEPLLATLKEKNIKIYTVGIGSIEGAPIPIIDRTGRMAGYIRDEKGQTVISQLNETLLKEIAQQTDGQYFFADNAQMHLDEIAYLINEKAGESLQDMVEYENYFWVFVALSLLLFVISRSLSFSWFKK